MHEFQLSFKRYNVRVCVWVFIFVTHCAWVLASIFHMIHLFVLTF